MLCPCQWVSSSSKTELRRQLNYLVLQGRHGARTACWLRVWVPAGAAREFSYQELFCADSYSVSVPPKVTAVARERPRSFYQKCRWQVTPKYACTLDPTRSDYAVQAQCGNLPGKTSSYATRQETLDHSPLIQTSYTACARFHFVLL